MLWQLFRTLFCLGVRWFIPTSRVASRGVRRLDDGEFIAELCLLERRLHRAPFLAMVALLGSGLGGERGRCGLRTSWGRCGLALRLYFGVLPGTRGGLRGRREVCVTNWSCVLSWNIVLFGVHGQAIIDRGLVVTVIVVRGHSLVVAACFVSGLW